MMRFAGVWEAFELSGRELGNKMEGAFLTTITPKPLWLGGSGILDVRASDWDKENQRVREHYGLIKLDPDIPTQGVRTVIYKDSHEIVHERIEFGADPEVLLVTPVEPGYNKHALRRTHQLLDC